ASEAHNRGARHFCRVDASDNVPARLPPAALGLADPQWAQWERRGPSELDAGSRLAPPVAAALLWQTAASPQADRTPGRTGRRFDGSWDQPSSRRREGPAAAW